MHADDYRAHFVGEYLTAVELDGDVTVEITGTAGAELEDPETQKPRHKLVVSLRDRKSWVLSRTAADCLAALFGSLRSGWVGHRVTLYRDPDVRVGAEKVGGIRVRGCPELREPIILVVKLRRRKPQQITLIPTGTTGARTTAHALADAGITTAQLDAWLRATGRPTSTPDGLARSGAWLTPERIAEIRAHQETP